MDAVLFAASFDLFAGISPGPLMTVVTTASLEVRRGAVNLDPSVRGLVETEVGVFVDGTRTFAAGPARMDSDLSHVSPHMVKRLQVVKGPYALTWGAGTLGAINVETYRPAFGVDGSVAEVVSATATTGREPTLSAASGQPVTNGASTCRSTRARGATTRTATATGSPATTSRAKLASTSACGRATAW